MGCIFIDHRCAARFDSFIPAIIAAGQHGHLFILATLLSTMALVFVMLDWTFFLIHMCYYIIAHYMQLIFIHPYEVERIQCIHFAKKVKL